MVTGAGAPVAATGGGFARSGRAAPSHVVLDLLRLTKPRITLMVVLTALAGMALAARRGTSGPGWQHAGAVLFGIALVVSAANALNMYLERRTDGLMDRTRQRPLPAGRLSPGAALAFGTALTAAGLGWLAWFTNAVTLLLSATALVLYVVVYTPLKRVTPLALLVGAVPGAIPPLLGWTAMTGAIDAAGAGLFAVQFFWQLPHFIAIATFRCEEYERAGIRVLPAVRGETRARIHAIAYTALLVAASVALVPLGVGGRTYLIVAVALGGAFVGVVLRGVRRVAWRGWARSVFVASLVYLPMLMAAALLGA